MGISIMIGNRIAAGRKSGAGYSGPAPLIHYDFSRYSNEDFLNNPDLLVKDLTGNGYDLKLYNFAFNGMSGFGGFVCDFNDFSVSTEATGLTITKSYNKIHIEISEDFSYANAINILASKWDISKDRTIKVTSTYNDVDNIKLVYNNSQNIFQDISLNGTTFISAFSGTIDNYIYLRFDSVKNKAGIIDIELLPNYPGALVSDGVDDYGLCVKDFALPNDYTICAIRKYPERNIGALCSKSHIVDRGAFIFEYGSGVTTSTGECASFGYTTRNILFPELFSYMTKDYYNGKTLRVGPHEDTYEDKLYLFTLRQGDTRFSKIALCELRIFDYSLTQEELLLVEDDMMSNYEKNAEPLKGITYVADWDAKGRSNDENVNVRNKWIDKATGKVINLNNFAYAGMSGWNGYNWDFLSDAYFSKNNVNITSNKVEVYADIKSGNFFCVNGNATGTEVPSFKVRISGLNTDAKLNYAYVAQSGDKNAIMLKLDNGEFNLPQSYLSSSTYSVYVGFKGNNINKGTTIEMIPLYPGSLVGDGIDDFGISQKVIDDEIATILCHFKMLNLESEMLEYILDRVDNIGREYIYKDSPNNNIYYGITEERQILINDGIFCHTHVPVVINQLQYIFSKNNKVQFGNVALYRLIFIKEQLNNQQLEFLKWKVDKEYRDWIKKNNYNIN